MEVSHTASLLLRDNGCVYFRLLKTQFRFLKAWKALPMDSSSSKFCHRLRAEQFLGDSQAVHLNSFLQGCPTMQISAEAAPSSSNSPTKGGKTLQRVTPWEPWDKQQFLSRRTEELCSCQRNCPRALRLLSSWTQLVQELCELHLNKYLQ